MIKIRIWRRNKIFCHIKGEIKMKDDDSMKKKMRDSLLNQSMM